MAAFPFLPLSPVFGILGLSAIWDVWYLSDISGRAHLAVLKCCLSMAHSGERNGTLEWQGTFSSPSVSLTHTPWHRSWGKEVLCGWLCCGSGVILYLTFFLRYQNLRILSAYSLLCLYQLSICTEHSANKYLFMYSTGELLCERLRSPHLLTGYMHELVLAFALTSGLAISFGWLCFSYLNAGLLLVKR